MSNKDQRSDSNKDLKNFCRKTFCVTTRIPLTRVDSCSFFSILVQVDLIGKSRRKKRNVWGSKVHGSATVRQAYMSHVPSCPNIWAETSDIQKCFGHGTKLWWDMMGHADKRVCQQVRICLYIATIPFLIPSGFPRKHECYQNCRRQRSFLQLHVSLQTLRRVSYRRYCLVRLRHFDTACFNTGECP